MCGSTSRKTWNSISSPATYSKPASASRASARRSRGRVANGTGSPLAKYGSHSTQPVFGAHGSTRKVVGSATISASAPPSIPSRPNPPPRVNTGNTVLCDVSFANSVEVMVTPSASALGSSAAVTVLPRRIPCWSGNENRITSTPRPASSVGSRRAAARWASVQRPKRLTKLIAGSASERVGERGRPGRAPPPRPAVLAPVPLPVARRPDAVDRHRTAYALRVGAVERHQRPLAALRIGDRLQQHPPVGDDDPVGRAEVLARAVVDPALR